MNPREAVRPSASGMLSRAAGRGMGGEIRHKKQMRFDRNRRNSTGNSIISRLSAPCRLVLSTRRHPAEPHLFFIGSPPRPSQCPAARESIPPAAGIYVTQRRGCLCWRTRTGWVKQRAGREKMGVGREKKRAKNKNSPRVGGLLFHNEGGDSFEWFINYLKYSIVKKCEQSMSIF